MVSTAESTTDAAMVQELFSNEEEALHRELVRDLREFTGSAETQAQAVDAAVRDAHAQEAQPEVDAYARVSSLSNSMTSLILAAERADAEEPPL